MGFEKDAAQGAIPRSNASLIEVRRQGGLAQLGEHLLCKQGVVGSIPSSSTIFLMRVAAESGMKRNEYVEAGCFFLVITPYE